MLTFQIEVAPNLEQMTRQYRNAREPIPERLTAPELILGLDLYLGAFFDLDRERTHVDVVTRIRPSQIYDYAERWNYNEMQTESLYHFVTAMDKSHCDGIALRSKTEKKREETASKWKSKK